MQNKIDSYSPRAPEPVALREGFVMAILLVAVIVQIVGVMQAGSNMVTPAASTAVIVHHDGHSVASN